MNLRIGTIEDLEIVKYFSSNFLATLTYPSKEDTLESFILSILTGPKDKYICILSDEGMIVGYAQPSPFNDEVLVASELAWWIEPEARAKGLGKELLEAFEYWAKEKANCKLITMVSLNDDLGKFYEKNNYKLYERVYMKEI